MRGRSGIRRAGAPDRAIPISIGRPFEARSRWHRREPRHQVWRRPVEQVNAALAFLPATAVLAGDPAGAPISSQVALITTDPT
jgi:hypothetical protein